MIIILGFRTKYRGQPTGFVEQILNGTKIHTLREDKNGRWKAGNSIELATGVRTKQYCQFMQGQCKSVQEVCINNYGILTIQVDGRFLLDKAEFNEFVCNDGFATQNDFEAWFTPLIKKNKGPLYLRCIHWTDKQY